MDFPTIVVQYRRPEATAWREVEKLYHTKRQAEAKAEQLYECGHTVRVVDWDSGEVLMDKEY